MKKLHRILIVAACVLLVASMASPAFATVSEVLYRGKQDGYNCVGTGLIDDNVAAAAFSATLSGELVPTIDPDMCSSSVTLITFTASGEVQVTSTGKLLRTDAGTRYVADSAITAITCTYIFNDITHGPYVLNASN